MQLFRVLYVCVYRTFGTHILNHSWHFFVPFRPNVTVTPPEMNLSSNPPSPEAMSDSPTDLPSTETDEPPLDFNPFHPAQRTSAAIPSMFMPPFPSKLQLRSMDEDEDLAVIDQVNRRLALGQLEPPLPWIQVPPGAGLLGYPHPSTEHYQETFTDPSYQHQQQQQGQQGQQESLPGPSTSQSSGQYFFPMETGVVPEASFQFNPVSLMVPQIFSLFVSIRVTARHIRCYCNR